MTTFKEAKKELQGFGFVLKKDQGTDEFITYAKGAPERQWNYTDDLEDAVGTAKCEARRMGLLK